MKPGAGKNKGSSFERKTAKLLSKWLTKGQDEKQLIRSVLSGGWDKANPDWRHVGDLAPNGPAGELFRRRFCVECKHHRSIDFWKLFTGQALLVDWWKKLDDECASYGLTPFLVIKANNRPTLLGTWHHYAPAHVYKARLIVSVEGFPDCVLIRLDNFLAEFNPERLDTVTPP